jgi:zinc protease
MPNEYAYSKTFFERWYRPQHTTVIVAGDVTPEQVLPMVEKYWGAWKGSGAAPADIPKEPAPNGPIYVHVPWASETLPWVTVGFPGPAFDEASKESAAMKILGSVFFGQTSDLYKKLVVTEQKVDELEVDVPASVDPSLFTVLARVKNGADTPYVRDQILAAVARARASLVPADRLADAKSFDRYSFARGIDSTERVAAVVSRYASYQRSYHTINNYYRTVESLTPADLQSAARRYFDDRGLIVATLSRDPLPAGIDRAPSLAALEAEPRTASGSGGDVTLVLQKSLLPQLDVKLLFTVGSVHDPAGKEGLAALTAAMMTGAGSKTMTIDQIDAALYPTAASFTDRTDKEMTTLTGLVHRDQWQKVLPIVLPQLLDQGWRQEDFDRLKTRQVNALVQDLRSSNEEELGKERLQTNIFHGTPYGHVALGTIAGLNAITLDDVKRFATQMYTRANLTLAVSGDAPDELLRDLQTRLRTLPEGPAAPRVSIDAPRPSGINVEILEKDTRATAISFGFPLDVTRAHADFAALSVARAWLGEHRLSSGRLYQRIREIRGINYGDYAYIEAFPRGMYQFFPDPNVARSRQIFEIWIRPVVPANAHMTLRLAIHELDSLVKNGLTRDAFEETRGYLMKNVYVMTSRQDQQLGYALDSRWYGIGEFTSYMRERLQKLTLDEVNAAIKRHLSTRDLSVVIVAKDAAGLKQALAADAFSPIKYDGEKPQSLLDEDKMIGALRLNIAPAKVTITPIADVFAR